jgi:hypothetical protein
MLGIRLAARREYLLKYTGEQNYLQLRAIYDPIVRRTKGPVSDVAAEASALIKDERPGEAETSRGVVC